MARYRGQVAEHHRDLGVQRVDPRGLEVWHRQQVAEPLRFATDDVMTVVDGHDGLDEGLTVRNRVPGALEQDILAALLAVEIRVDETQDAHARGFEFLNCGHPGPPPNCRYIAQRLADMILTNSSTPDRLEPACWLCALQQRVARCD